MSATDHFSRDTTGLPESGASEIVDVAPGGSYQLRAGRPLGVLRSAHLRTFTVIRISWCSEQPNRYLPGTVSLRLNR